MKKVFVDTIIKLYKEKPFIFLTGDLGYNMLEPLRDLMGDRFINCGIAEQNMVGMAAGMAKAGESVWVYSIAPFLYARAFEQIRNDVCFHNLPVKLVGMGGGYHYGDLGPSHWALEDYGTLLTLPNIKCYVPASAESAEHAILNMNDSKKPSYLRLGRCEKEPGVSTVTGYSDGSVLLQKGYFGNIITTGAIAWNIVRMFSNSMEMERPNIILYEKLSATTHCLSTINTIVVEEHIRQGGLGQMLGLPSINAKHFTDGPYGSQQYMRERAGITYDKIMEALRG